MRLREVDVLGAAAGPVVKTRKSLEELYHILVGYRRL